MEDRLTHIFTLKAFYKPAPKSKLRNRTPFSKVKIGIINH